MKHSARNSYSRDRGVSKVYDTSQKEKRRIKQKTNLNT